MPLGLSKFKVAIQKAIQTHIFVAYSNDSWPMRKCLDEEGIGHAQNNTTSKIYAEEISSICKHVTTQ